MAMLRYSLKVAILTVLLLLLARAEQPQEQSALLNFLVLKDDNGKPIRNASVVLHPVNERGKQAKGGYELKADAEGKASFDGAPYGKLRVQVLAPGFQTWGEDFDIERPTVEITVRLKRPQGQYSIYEDHPRENKDDTQKPPEKQQ